MPWLTTCRSDTCSNRVSSWSAPARHMAAVTQNRKHAQAHRQGPPRHPRHTALPQGAPAPLTCPSWQSTGHRYLLFPRLRAVADLLMMPKEVLTDRAIRSEVVPGLSLRVICTLLARFHPDDFAAEPLPPGASCWACGGHVLDLIWFQG